MVIDTLNSTDSHNFCISISVHQKKKLKAFKFLSNYLQFLDENKATFNEAILAEKRLLAELLVESYKKEQYDEIFRLCCHELNARDWLKAEEYFKSNPGKVYCGAKNGLLYSYIKTDNSMIRRQHELGIGNFGRVKAGITHSDQAQPSVIKRQTLDTTDPYNSRHWLEAVKKEAAVNLDVGIALSELVVRTNNDGSVYKVYQDLRYLGKPLSSVVSNIDPASDRNRVGYAILLLSQVFKLHSGLLATSGKKYAHGDIKPENVVIDEHNALHLIDFAMANDEHLLEAHYACSGTKQYMPFNIVSSGSSLRMNNTVEKTPSLFFDDKIAVLRTIYHPCEKGIFTTEVYEHLPLPLQSLLSTQDIQQCVRADEQDSLKFILSSFIFYVENGYRCSAEELQELANNPQEQESLIMKLQEDSSFQAALFVSTDHAPVQQLSI
jgi:serine/threonine protein kinase